jgi:hypothetical protein
MKGAVHTISTTGSLTNLIMHANIFPFRQDRHNCMNRKVNERKFGKGLAVTNDGRTDHRHCRNIVRLEDLFLIENAFFGSNLYLSTL